MYQPRIYRHWIKDEGLICFNVVVKETDLYIRARTNLASKALQSAKKYRSHLEEYIEHHPSFLTTHEPFVVGEDAPYIVKQMAEAAQSAGVGPMAAVAGAIADGVGRDLLAFSPEVIVENGGDIFLKSLKRRLIGIYAGESPFTGKLALQIEGEETPLGVCTSSGTVGHSFSLGRADAAIALSSSSSLADAAATAIGNMVKETRDIPGAIRLAQDIKGLKGMVIIKGDRIGLWGEVKICRIQVRN